MSNLANRLRKAAELAKRNHPTFHGSLIDESMAALINEAADEIDRLYAMTKRHAVVSDQDLADRWG